MAPQAHTGALTLFELSDLKHKQVEAIANVPIKTHFVTELV